MGGPGSGRKPGSKPKHRPKRGLKATSPEARAIARAEAKLLEVRERAKQKEREINGLKAKGEDGGDPMIGQYISYALTAFELPPLVLSDPAAVKQRSADYLSYCMTTNMRPSLPGWGMWLGVDRRTLQRWKDGADPYGPEHQDIIRRFYTVMDSIWADYMQGNKLNPVAGIYLSKNWYGYKDQQDVVVTPVDPLGDAPDAERLYADYAERLPDALPESGEKPADFAAEEAATLPAEN